MKKFLTFFAMMFALLGFSPAIHADWTFYVDTSNNGWSDAYIQVGNDTAWYSDYHGNVVPNTNGKVYKFYVRGWSDLTRIHFAPTPGHSTQQTDGTNGNGSYTKDNPENLWKAVNNRCYVLNSGNGSSSCRDNYTPPTPPYIFIDGASHPFEAEGSNWVYKIDASTAAKEFRLQKVDNKTALGTNVSGVALVPNGCVHTATTNISSYTSTLLSLYGNFSGRLTVDAGYVYTLTINSGLSQLTMSKTETNPANPEASIKSVELRDANNNLLCTLTQNTGTGETNYWTGITTVALPKAADNIKL